MLIKSVASPTPLGVDYISMWKINLGGLSIHKISLPMLFSVSDLFSLISLLPLLNNCNLHAPTLELVYFVKIGPGQMSPQGVALTVDHLYRNFQPDPISEATGF